jgi:hydrophobic/amphiphilic exporter-1 (mainly G- bacteria), HAE1 family
MSLAETSIKRPIFITSIVALMLIIGFTSLKKMSVDLFPDVTFPVIFIQTVYPGASPLDMEKLVSKKIEDELGSLSSLNKITSQNLESVSVVILEFKIGTDIKEREQQVRDRIGNLRNRLPSEIKEPVIRRFDPADQPILRLAVSSDVEPGLLFDHVDELVKPQFERINGVGQVSIVGGRKREIQILVDKDKLQDRRLSMAAISERIRSTSKDVPIGKYEADQKETVLRASGEFDSVDALKKVNVNFIGSDQSVRLDQIAKINIGLESEKYAATLNGKQALFIDIYKQSGSNTVKVADTVKAQVENVNKILADKNIEAKVQMVRDGSKPIRMNIADVFESIIIGIVLCVIVVFFFLGSARSTFITGMALPNSLLGGFIIMYAMGFSINLMTLLALSLAVGLLIDDAIVVRENIFRHLEMGKTAIQAALDGTKEVSLAVIATTMVVIAVFGPIAFLDGIIGQFFKQFGLTVVFTMLISLFDAFTVAPMLSAYMATSGEHEKSKGFVGSLLAKFDQGQTWLEQKYETTLKWVLGYRKTTLALAVVVFFASLGSIPFIPKTFLPANDNGEFFVIIERKPGASLSSTRELVTQVEKVLLENKAVEVVATVAGTESGEGNKATLFVQLVPRKDRAKNTTQIKDDFRKVFPQFDDQGMVNVGEVDISGGNQKPFNLSLTGEDLDALNEYTKKLMVRLAKVKGLVDVDTNFREGKPEYKVKFDREKSEQLGVSTVTAGAELRTRVEGSVPSTYREAGREYDIRLKLDPKFENLKEQFASTLIPNVNFNMIPLAKVAQGEDATGFSQINRQNKNRFIMISGSIGPGGSLGDITNEVERILKTEEQPPSGINYSFAGQAEDFRDLINNMLLAMFLGVVFIYLVLASLYESFITPLTILLALPLAMTGAFLGLLVFGKSIDIFSLIGIVMLLGVVAKNSILLVDYANQLIGQGMERNQALLKAGVVRLRPILMTSLALIAGTIPIAIGLNEASAMRTSMGVAIIGGVLSSTALTLVVVPAAFGYIEEFRIWLGQKLSRFLGAAQQKTSH